MDCTILVLAWEGDHEFKYYSQVIVICVENLYRNGTVSSKFYHMSGKIGWYAGRGGSSTVRPGPLWRGIPPSEGHAVPLSWGHKVP